VSLRHPLPSVLVLAGLLWLAAACNSGGKNQPTPTPASPDEASVVQLVQHELQLTRAGNWHGLYATFSPRLQQLCPLDRYVAAMTSHPNAAATSDVQYSNLNVRIEGDVAYVTFDIAVNGTMVPGITDAHPDRFAKINGGWYFDDTSAVC